MAEETKQEPVSKQPTGEIKPGELGEKELDKTSGGRLTDILITPIKTPVF